MVKDGIITKVTEPTDWVNSIVLVEKPKTGKLRVCIDPKALNDAIRRPHYQMPTLDDVTSELSGATHLSILDITHAYWSVKVRSRVFASDNLQYNLWPFPVFKVTLRHLVIRRHISAEM